MTAYLPRQRVQDSPALVLKMYGGISGTTGQNSHGTRLSGKAMVWVMDDRTAVVVQNMPTQADGILRTVVPVERVTVQQRGYGALTILTQDGGTLTVTAASCVCGAGLAGSALPYIPDPGYQLAIPAATSTPDWLSL